MRTDRTGTWARAVSPTTRDIVRESDLVYLDQLSPPAAGQPFTLRFSYLNASVGQLVGWVTLWAGWWEQDARVKVAEDLEVRCITTDLGGTAIIRVPTALTDGLTAEQWANLSLTFRYPKSRT